ncbi:MAG: superoxide dismutase [Candidatus Buchananbacteria bacterium RIFCSPHIGHO2_02_FULL_38_8]|uniref:Superoxide dismutase n=2 Tax=Candidatus Buchananiibacteriota TaxID=1817903 RepID=A0A1G1Y1R1_9BACT|nr:MAG: superoxide dismutase [Candidatus Buchananbacteria bacterium RIFCSPHIGHO2_01_FULL_39_8]OGY47258.1 MAG: superoxide dismutase [Candidatus Buchananbacteria bacterium RIFCSPHIGHO2_02_FULL_38_8]
MHQLDPLPYPYDSLEPYIDEETMKIHHDKHHQGYIDKLNKALEGHDKLTKESIEKLLSNLDSVPAEIKTAVKNNGGGHYHHHVFWPMLKKDVKPQGEVTKAIEKKFGSLDSFKEEFTKAASTLFGSGWTWLVVNNGELEIVNTSNQDSPIGQGKIPVLGIDVWEHAYYLKYQNRRPEYIEAFFNIINWEQINKNYLETKK